MKRVIKASFGGDYDSSFDEDWVVSMKRQIQQFVSQELKKLGLTDYECKFGRTEEDYYGYPVIIVRIYQGSDMASEIQISTYEDDTEIHHLTPTAKDYIKEELEYLPYVE